MRASPGRNTQEMRLCIVGNVVSHVSGKLLGKITGFGIVNK